MFYFSRRLFAPVLVLFVFAGTVFGEVAVASNALSNDVGYVVQSGDSLSKIAQRFQVSVNEILTANPDLNTNPNVIQPGMILAIPQGGAAVQVYLEPPVDIYEVVSPPMPTQQQPVAINLDQQGIPFTIAGGLRGGVVQYIDYTSASVTGCGDGSYSGNNVPELSQIYGDLLMLTDTKVNTSRADGVGKACVTISTTYGGTQTAPKVFINGYQVPYRGPVLSARNYGTFGVIETEVQVDCNDSYTLELGVRAESGQLVEQLLQIAVPCE